VHLRSVQADHFPSVVLVGGGAAGLWTAMRLLEAGWQGERLTIIEPSGKTEDDHTWGYWAHESLLPPEVEQSSYNLITLAAHGERATYVAAPFRYFSVRSSAFYAYAKQRLAEAGVVWVSDVATQITDNESHATVQLSQRKASIAADYALDSRPPSIDLQDKSYYSTLQHFGGWFVETHDNRFNPDEVVFMDFLELDKEVGFFYVIPYGARKALVQLAIFSKTPWPRDDYDSALSDYLTKRYPGAYRVIDWEYGAIPMTDAPLWSDSTHRVWRIGTRGGWVQPSSGYAFSRCARFGGEVADQLLQANPKPWKPSPVHQTFNSVMLGAVIDRPEMAGHLFLDLFQRNGVERVFSFLDEQSGVAETLKLMWQSPRTEFSRRAVTELAARIKGRK